MQNRGPYITDGLPRDPGDAEEIEFIPSETEGGMINVGSEAEDAVDPIIAAMEEVLSEGDEGPDPASLQFDANLASFIPPQDLTSIATELLELYRQDRDARSKRDKIYASGIKQTGFGEPAPGGADFEGASRVTYPLMGEAAIDFAASASKELLPPEGPVRTKVLNEDDQTSIKRAERKKRYMNWLLTTGCPQFYAEHEQMLPQLGLSGAGYIKLWWDEGLQCEFINESRAVLPYNCSGWRSAYRRAIDYDWDEVEIRDKVNSGFLRPEPFEVPSAEAPEPTEPETANNAVEGKDQTTDNLDGTRRVIEFDLYYDLSGEDAFLVDPEGNSRPGWYKILVDEQSEGVAAIYRKYDPAEFQRSGRVKEVHNVVEYGFIPWEDASYVGLAHVAGGICKAITGGIRALHDAALIANQPGGLRLKGARNSGENIKIKPTAVVEIDGVDTNDIRKVFMPLPFNGPDAVLYQLVGMLIEAGKGIVSTAEEKIADASANMPVGTTIALIEQGSKVMSSIHARLHRSFAMELEIIHRLLAENLEPGEVELDTGFEMVTPEEFDGPMDIIPVSDPNIFAETQRFAILTEVAKLIESPMFQSLGWNLDALARRFLAMLKVPNADELLPPPPESVPMNAVEENASMVGGNPSQVYPFQEHVAHLQIHFQFLASPSFGMNRIMAQTLIPAILQHIKDHLAFYYADMMGKILQRESGIPMEQLMQIDADGQTDQLSSAFAQISVNAMKEMDEQLSQAPKIIEAAAEFLKKVNPSVDQLEVIQKQADALLTEAQAAQIEAQVENAKSQRQEDRDDIEAANRIEIDKREQDRKDAELLLKAEIEAKNAEIAEARAELDEMRLAMDRINANRDRELKRQEMESRGNGSSGPTAG